MAHPRRSRPFPFFCDRGAETVELLQRLRALDPWVDAYSVACFFAWTLSLLESGRLLPRALPTVRAGCWCHIVNRGLNGFVLFPTPAAMQEFVEQLGRIAFEFQLEIHAYCVMGTHYHLLVRGPEDEIPRAVASLETDVSTRTGPARLLRLAAGRHLLQVTCYIHRNPVAASLVSRPGDWLWSSYRGYLDPLAGPDWLRSRIVLGWLGSLGPRLRYRDLVEFNGKSEFDRLDFATSDGAID